MHNYSRPYIEPCTEYSTMVNSDFNEETFNKALDLIRESVQREKADELLYEYLISVAPTEEEKVILSSIKDDSKNHVKYFSEMYYYYTCKNLQSNDVKKFMNPISYIEGINKIIFDNLTNMENHKFIKNNLPDKKYADTLFKIITDDIEHISKCNYILSKNSNILPKNIPYDKPNFYIDKTSWADSSDNYRQTEFTLNELAEYDGTSGKPAYVAVNGIVYDVSSISKWKMGKHYGLTAGKDLTSEFENCHGVKSKLEKLPKVGVLKS